MCSTSTGTQNATSSEAVRQARRIGTAAGGGPGGGPPGGGGGPGPVVLKPHLKPEHVPEHTFIAAASPADNGFIQSAVVFHTFFGLAPKTIKSLEDLVRILSQNSGTLKRIRVVAHSHPSQVLLPFFDGGPVGLPKQYLRGFAKSDKDGLLAVMGIPHFNNWDTNAILDVIRSTPAGVGVLTPFGLATSSPSPGNLAEFLNFGFDLAFASRPATLRQNNKMASAAEAGFFTAAFNFILDELQTAIVGTTISGTVITTAHMQALRPVLAGLSISALGLTPPDTVFDFSSTIDLFQELRRAMEAIKNRSFRQNLTTARDRFSQTSIIDVRGCRAGEIDANTNKPDYLEAFAEFFGKSEQLPEVTGPEWFQEFPTLGTSHPATEAAIDGIITSGVSVPAIPAAEFVQDFDAWADAVLVDTAHMNFWKTLFQGTAINFCLLSWRTAIPAIGLESGRLAGIDALSFADTVGRVRDIFNVAAASAPNASALNALTPFVTSLPGVNQKLTAPAPPAAQLNPAHQELLAISQQLGQSIVPAAPPPGMSNANIQQWKTQLTQFIENTHLAAIKTFLTVCAAKANHANAKYRYFLFLGLPALIYRNVVPNPFARNAIIALEPLRDEAIRRLLRSYWAEPLPAGSSVDAATFDNVASHQVCILTSDHAHAQTAMCPTEAYDSHIKRRP
jgi:hypothetical protein